MKILHTSDWHLGRSLYTQKRYPEFESFLNWLLDILQREQVDVLLVAGDIFDTSTPSNRAQQLYYRFLCQVAASRCRHVVIIAGNHDSPSFLNAPKELLKVLDVHVVGAACVDPEDEAIVLSNEEGVPELIVCAVPYLRDRDIRIAEAGESIDDKDRKLVEGIQHHYAKVTDKAEQKRATLGRDIPIIGMGHLFVTGGQTIDGDGVRELYVGSLAHVAAGLFPKGLDYLALGHLHVPQRVNGSEVMRYCGSPIPMGFGEAMQKKSVVLLEFAGKQADVRLLEVPVFQQLVRIKGCLETIQNRLVELVAMKSQAWLELIYDGDEVISDLRNRMDAIVAGSDLKILRVKNNRIIDRVLAQEYDHETLDDLDVNDVFQRCLSVHEVPEQQRADLLRVYNEVIHALVTDDLNAG